MLQKLQKNSDLNFFKLKQNRHLNKKIAIKTVSSRWKSEIINGMKKSKLNF